MGFSFNRLNSPLGEVVPQSLLMFINICIIIHKANDT